MGQTGCALWPGRNILYVFCIGMPEANRSQFLFLGSVFRFPKLQRDSSCSERIFVQRRKRWGDRCGAPNRPVWWLCNRHVKRLGAPAGVFFC